MAEGVTAIVVVVVIATQMDLSEDSKCSGCDPDQDCCLVSRWAGPMLLTKMTRCVHSYLR